MHEGGGACSADAGALQANASEGFRKGRLIELQKGVVLIEWQTSKENLRHHLGSNWSQQWVNLCYRLHDLAYA